ncbi:MAG TPA: cytochrome c oxidase subunit II [Solirubrobacteraceae bacterium]|nr:cytochrome c oxidase subunit II [Solirubrobacteraceae bacterium]
MLRRARCAAGVLLAVALAGCGDQSALAPRSEPAREIATLWWWMLAIAGTVLGGALFLLFIGFLRRRTPGIPLLGKREGVATALVVVFGILIPLGTNVAVFVVANFVVAKATEAPDPRTTPMRIEVIGHQWFWEVRYPGTTAITANEIHIPAGTRVNVVATTDDVIHSFWVPQLNRKIDMIPGHTNRVLLEADEPGRYRGQCAEFCGAQHSHMAMYVYADPPDRFRRWLDEMAADAAAPATAEARRGERVFLDNACASCHTIRGTEARGEVGPDLTHLQSRSTLAALTIPNRPGYLAGWVLDPQHVKPGNRMPGLKLANDDFNALLAYLEGLK